MELNCAWCSLIVAEEAATKRIPLPAEGEKSQALRGPKENSCELAACVRGLRKGSPDIAYGENPHFGDDSKGRLLGAQRLRSNKKIAHITRITGTTISSEGEADVGTSTCLDSLRNSHRSLDEPSANLTRPSPNLKQGPIKVGNLHNG